MDADTIGRIWIAFLFIIVWPTIGITTVYIGFKLLNWACKILFGKGL